MSFKENLKKYREKAGYKTAKDFARTLSVSYDAYMGYETKGREPKFTILIEIAMKLGVSLDELLGYKYQQVQKCVQFLKSYGLYIVACPNKTKSYVISNVSGKPSWKDFTFTITESDLIRYVQQIQNSPKYQEPQKNYTIKFIRNENARHQMKKYLDTLINGGTKDTEIYNLRRTLDTADNDSIEDLSSHIVAYCTKPATNMRGKKGVGHRLAFPDEIK